MVTDGANMRRKKCYFSSLLSCSDLWDKDFKKMCKVKLIVDNYQPTYL